MIKKKPKITAPKTPNKGGYQVQDVWFHRAKAAGYRARSAFKLIQIQEETNIIRPGMTILDLGCAPGSWLQVLSKSVGEDGCVLGVDLQEVERFPQKNIRTLVGDMTAVNTHEEIRNYLQNLRKTHEEDFQKQENNGVWGLDDEKKRSKKSLFDMVTSDVAPKTTGRNDDDQYHSAMLCLEVLTIANKFLTRGGTLVMKIFVGRDLSRVLAQAKAMFKKVRCIKPDACRDRSFEEYVICQGYER